MCRNFRGVPGKISRKFPLKVLRALSHMERFGKIKTTTKGFLLSLIHLAFRVNVVYIRDKRMLINLIYIERII